MLADPEQAAALHPPLRQRIAAALVRLSLAALLGACAQPSGNAPNPAPGSATPDPALTESAGESLQAASLSGPAVSHVSTTPNPAATGSNITLSAKVSSAGGTVTKAEYRLDDGQPWSSVALAPTDGRFDSASENVSVALRSLSPGVYNVCVRGTDTRGTGTPGCTLLAVYDGSLSFATGFGTVNSPAGAYQPSPGRTGKTNFAFSAYFPRGKTTPNGKLLMNFSAGNLTLIGTRVSTLTISPDASSAQFSGTGLVVGRANTYKFTVWATDASQDTFRIKIWQDTSRGPNILYDLGSNQALTVGGIAIRNGAVTPPGVIPSITSLDPASGPGNGGNTVTINGANFTGVSGVMFGAQPATNVTVINDSKITVTAPAGSGTVNVVVSTPSAVSNAKAYAYVPVTQAPNLTGLAPTSGPLGGGTAVTISGANLGSATSVKFGANAVTPTSVSDSQVIATSPAATSPGPVDVTVMTPAGTSNPLSFTYTQPASSVAKFQIEKAGGGSIGTQAVGTPFDLQITAQDASNNTVTSFTGTVDLTSTGTLTAGGGTTAAFVGGVLAPHSVTIGDTGNFTITATRTGSSETGTSNAFDVVTETAPTVVSSVPADGATAASNANVSVTFSEPVNVTGNWSQITCVTSGTHPAALSGGPTTFALDPATDFTPGESCTVTIVAAQVTDQDTVDPPDNMAANSAFSFTVEAAPPVDTPPAAVNDSGAVNEDSGATAIDVLGNDTDPDGGPKTISAVTQAANGTVAITGGGTGLTYQPNANSCNTPPGTALDTFTYTLTPGGTTATVTVTVTCVDDLPTAVNDSGAVNEDSGATAIDVLGNDTDIDGGPRSIGAVTQAANGTVVITGGGTGLTYQPNANFCNTPPASAPDTFTYTLNGGSTGTVGVSVTCLNDAPVAQTRTASAQANMQIVGLNASLLTGVTDADSGVNGCTPTFTVASISAGSGGTVSNVNLTAGTFDFDPAPGFTGTATVNYTVSDTGCPAPATTSAPATINVTVMGPVIWFVNPAGSAGNGTLSSPFNTLAAADAVDAAGHRVFLSSGTVPTGLTLNANEWLIGQGASGSFDAFFGITPPAGTIARPSLGGTRPTVGGTITLGGSSRVQGLNISTSGVTGLSGGAVSGVTVNEASVSATNATAVSLNGTGGTVTLTRVDASNAANGIVLTNQTGSFSVTGSGTAGSGGTIQNTSGADGAQAGNGVYLSNASNVSLNWMALSNHQNNALYGVGVRGLTLDRLTTSGNNGTSNSGTFEESSVHLVDLGGTVSITNSTLNGGAWDNVLVRNTSGTAPVLNLTFSNNTISQMQGAVTDVRNTAFQVIAGDGTANVTAQGNTITFWWGNAMQVIVQGGASGTAAIRNNSVMNSSGALAGAGGIWLSGGNLTYDIAGNTVAYTSGAAISVDETGALASNLQGTIQNNTIGVAGVNKSGSAQGSGIFVGHLGTGTSTVSVKNNTLRQTNGSTAITVQIGDAAAGGGNGRLNASVTGNNIAQPGSDAAVNSGLLGIYLNIGTVTNDAHTACLDVSGNSITNFGLNRIRPNQRFLTAVQLPGYAGGPTDNAAVTSYFSGRNPGTTVNVAVSSVAGTPGYVGVTSCPQPSTLP